MTIYYKVGLVIWKTVYWTFVVMSILFTALVIDMSINGVVVKDIRIPLIYLLIELQVFIAIITIVRLIAGHHYKKTL